MDDGTTPTGSIETIPALKALDAHRYRAADKLFLVFRGFDNHRVPVEMRCASLKLSGPSEMRRDEVWIREGWRELHALAVYANGI